MLEGELKGFVKVISKNYIVIESNDKEYLATKSDFFYKDINVNDKVIFKGVNDNMLKACYISLDK